MTHEAVSSAGRDLLAVGAETVPGRTGFRDRFAGLARRYAHVSWALADQALVSGCSFATGILAARALGVTEFGRFTLAWLVVLCVATLQHAAINAPMMSIGPKQSLAEAPAYYGAVVVQEGAMVALSFVAVYCGTVAAAALFPQWYVGELALPLAAVAGLWHLQDFVRRTLFSRGRATRAMLNDAISYGGQVTLLAWVARDSATHVDTGGVLWIMAGTCGLAVAHGAAAMAPLVWSRVAVRAVLARHRRFAAPLVASAVLAWPCNSLVFVIAGAVFGPAAVGGMRAAQNLMGVSHVLLLSLENFALKVAARRLVQGGIAEMLRYFHRLGAASVLAMAAMALAIVLPREFWMALVFGVEYASFADLLLWFGGVYLLWVVAAVLVLALRTMERTGPILAAFGASGIALLVAAYPMAVAFGLPGLMAVWVGNQAVLAFFLYCGLRATPTATDVPNAGG